MSAQSSPQEVTNLQIVENESDVPMGDDMELEEDDYEPRTPEDDNERNNGEEEDFEPKTPEDDEPLNNEERESYGPKTPEDDGEENKEGEEDDGGPKTPEDDDEEEEEEDDDQEYDEDAIRKSRIQKESFLEIFRIAPTVRDIIPDLQNFVNHPEVIKPDKEEIELLVEKKIEEERAKKKAEKASKKAKEAREQVVAEKPSVGLAEAIKNVTGLDLAGILQKAGKSVPTVANIPITETINLVPPSRAIPASNLPPEVSNLPIMSIGSAPITAVRVGKAGFATPAPFDVKPRKTTMADVAPIPEALRTIQNHNKPAIAPIPNELLPLDQRVPVAPQPAVYVLSRPPIRKTLLMAGARAGKRKDIREALSTDGKKKSETKSSASNKTNSFKNNYERRGRRDAVGGGGGGSWGGSNALPSTLNKNTPVPVRRYHASRLAKETGMTYDEAMDEIDARCERCDGDVDPASREADEATLDAIKARGDRRFNERNNYIPMDHSQGIPGVDRPPAGDRIDREMDVGSSRDREFERERERRRNKRRGGVKEREKQRRREERREGGYGGGGRNQWAQDDRDRGAAGGAPQPKYGRYEDQRGQDRYDEYNTYQQESGAYEDNQYYEGYYEGQEDYRNYDQGTADAYSYDYYQGQDDQQGSYYQEDGSQYYNEYYGTSEAGHEEYQATFDHPAAPTSSARPPE